MQICVEKTAITNGISKSVEEFSSLFEQDDPILDYGCGKLRNSNFLKSKGFRVSVLDTEKQIERHVKAEDWEQVLRFGHQSKERFKGIFCTFVLNVVPSIQERKNILLHIHSLLQTSGIAIIEVRGTKGIEQNKFKEPFQDGFLIGKHTIKTFQKGFTLEELVSFTEEHAFEILKKKKYADSVVVVARRKQ